MSDTIIRVENLGKKYIIGHQQEGHSRYVALRDVLADGVKSLFSRQEKQAQKEEFWALKDVSFEVKQGEVIGIIGRNGAGKSTLLKILSRITEPTTGRIQLGGRVASLLEVGTGFHPELTGRENIYLNGAILGMTKVEIKQKFDEIVDFAEVEKFLDTPVKRYSSGMYVRLAFAVAAHLEPEILVVDEVLAVGDAQFQKKCLGKMGDVAAKEGRTVLFVSHNMPMIRALCQRVILLKKGIIQKEDYPEAIIENYLRETDVNSSVMIWDSHNAPQTEEIRLLKAYVLNEQKEYTSTLKCDQEFHIVLEYETFKTFTGLRIGFQLQNSEGIVICGSNTPIEDHNVQEVGKYQCSCTLISHHFNSGHYSVLFGCDTFPKFERLLTTSLCISFTIEDVEGHGYLHEKLPGIVRPKLEWKTVLQRLC